MRVTEIRIDRTKSLGNYENIKLGLSAVICEAENAIDAIERLKLVIDWELNKEDREIQYEKFKAQLTNGSNASESIKRWVEKYESHQAQIIEMSA